MKTGSAGSLVRIDVRVIEVVGTANGDVLSSGSVAGWSGYGDVDFARHLDQQAAGRRL